MARAGRTERRRRVVAVLVLVLAVMGFTAYTQFGSEIQPDTVPPPSTSAPTEQAVQALGRLAVRERAPRTGYSRDQFGSGWAVVDGCDTRNRILQRDLDNVVLDADSCTVLTGILSKDPYTDKTIEFKRGPDTSQAVQIDHVVALSDAWQKGAQGLSPDRRIQFANDPLNLLAVDGPANMQKGDSDASDWLPPNKSYQCRYVARQIAVKVKYILWVTSAELNAMRRTLALCTSEMLPS